MDYIPKINDRVVLLSLHPLTCQYNNVRGIIMADSEVNTETYLLKLTGVSKTYGTEENIENTWVNIRHFILDVAHYRDEKIDSLWR